MTKKTSGSAAQRRAYERQERERRENTRAAAVNKGVTPKRPERRVKKDRSGLYMIIGVVALLAIIVGAFIFTRWYNSLNVQYQRATVNTSVLSTVTGVNQTTWESVGAGSVKTKFTAESGQSILKGSNGLPEFLYVGGEFCPYCAGERWAMVQALSRFGSFTNLKQIQSYEDNINTFSFYGSSYTSQYVNFTPVEVNGNTLNSAGTGYATLETLTAAQEATFKNFNPN